MTQKGQVTIPSAVRRRLGLRPKDRVVFEVRGDVVVVRAAASKALKWYGALATAKASVPAEVARQEFERGVAAEVTAETD